MGHSPLPRNFFLILDLKMAICGAFLVQFFAVQLKLLGGEKILSPRYIFIGGGQSPPPHRPPGSTPLPSGPIASKQHPVCCSRGAGGRY